MEVANEIVFFAVLGLPLAIAIVAVGIAISRFVASGSGTEVVSIVGRRYS